MYQTEFSSRTLTGVITAPRNCNTTNPLRIYIGASQKHNPFGEHIGAFVVRALHSNGSVAFTLEKNVTENSSSAVELVALIEALNTYIKDPDLLAEYNVVEVITTSGYLMKGVNEWLDDWKEQDWKGSNKKTIKKAEAWKELANIRLKVNLEIDYVDSKKPNVQLREVQLAANSLLKEAVKQLAEA